MKNMMFALFVLIVLTTVAWAGAESSAITALNKGTSAVICDNGNGINEQYAKVKTAFPNDRIDMVALERVSDTFNNQAICVLLQRMNAALAD